MAGIAPRFDYEKKEKKRKENQVFVFDLKADCIFHITNFLNNPNQEIGKNISQYSNSLF